MSNFAVICKGKSLQRLPEILNKFNSCFIVNNFQYLEKYLDMLKSKKVVYYSNRLSTAVMSKENYKRAGIRKVQFTKPVADKSIKALSATYKKMGMKTNLLPEELMKFNKRFGEEYAHKHPNTGLLAITHAAHIIRPANLWICGFDLYEVDYLRRRDVCLPLKKQQGKISKLCMKSAFIEVVEQHPNVMFHLATYMKDLPKLANLVVL